MTLSLLPSTLPSTLSWHLMQSWTELLISFLTLSLTNYRQFTQKSHLTVKEYFCTISTEHLFMQSLVFFWGELTIPVISSLQMCPPIPPSPLIPLQPLHAPIRPGIALKTLPEDLYSLADHCCQDNAYFKDASLPQQFEYNLLSANRGLFCDIEDNFIHVPFSETYAINYTSQLLSEISYLGFMGYFPQSDTQNNVSSTLLTSNRMKNLCKRPTYITASQSPL